ncbi:glutamate synthase domain-containing protein 2 [Sinobacterium caligoides]|uniref:Glutamate synthase domain-containing protein 2 n=1 Tax=Sinobacterium caligoides TaxID=933926 RepID=A0A3N2E0Y1_9GAMM|nr:FMN-binding glutamate synthase family protein [Sinobacterium caligoides]ROS05770.1 glutamate synthase domain-containing protein 2 [Sinobacterium caligoides]
MSTVIDIITDVFLLLLFVLLVSIAITYVIDVRQHRHAIRRNYPVVGRFRYWFEHLGGFFRQYFFAMDREEMPFNRAQRAWVYRAAKNVDTTVAFGSTRNITQSGTPLFICAPFPTMKKDSLEPSVVTIGEGCRTPYSTASLFNISGMSYGAISQVAVTSLSRGAKLAGCWLNTGEGGVSPYHLDGGADLVVQIGTAKYGVRDHEGKLSHEKLLALAAREQVKMFELKLSQGAKPGKGGILPAGKVTAEVAALRGIPEGQDSISPNRHPDIGSVAELLDRIEEIRELTGKPVGFKTVLGDDRWLEELTEEILRRGKASAPDFITVDSADGGTGAAPQSLIDYVGMPIRQSLPMLCDKLVEAGLKQRVKVIASGKLINPAEAALALCVGADFVVSARGFMFALGCIQSLQCNKNTCPTGVATQDKKLQRGLDVIDKTARVTNYARQLSYEIGMIAHSCGVKEPRQLQRQHVRIVTEHGLSMRGDELFPNKQPLH